MDVRGAKPRSGHLHEGSGRELVGHLSLSSPVRGGFAQCLRKERKARRETRFGREARRRAASIRLWGRVFQRESGLSRWEKRSSSAHGSPATLPDSRLSGCRLHPAPLVAFPEVPALLGAPWQPPRPGSEGWRRQVTGVLQGRAPLRRQEQRRVCKCHPRVLPPSLCVGRLGFSYAR